MTGTYQDFTGVNLLQSSFEKVVGKVLVKNELGGVSDGYELVHAGGDSGYSFGGNQMDLSQSTRGRVALKEILNTAKDSSGNLIFTNGGQFYEDNKLRIESAGNPTALSVSEISLINQALTSSEGEFIINTAFLFEVIEKIAYVNGIIDSLPNGNIKTSLQNSDEMRTYLIDYHNQFNLATNGKMSKFLKGELVDTYEGTPMQLNGMVTADDIRLFVSRTEQSVTSPTAFNNRYNDTASTLITEGVGKYFSGNNSDNTFTGTINSDDLNGNGGNDTLSGGAGKDVLNGNSGNDILTGGADADKFVIARQLGGATTIIKDFSTTAANEKIDLSAFTNITSLQLARNF